jgi:hypothetical protein
MECYIECDKNAVAVESVGGSEGLAVLKGLFKRKRQPRSAAQT